MGSFVFKWEHPASEVYVTGTFDDWKKTEQLEKKGDIFEKDVTLSSADAKIYYKFVVDGNWVTDHTAPQENDESGNLNNVLTTDRIIKHKPETAGIMSGVAPTSTTAGLAKDVPLEKSTETTGSSDLPGSFPETPAAAEEKAGDEQKFGVAPLPAFPGGVNPVKTEAGEKVPASSELTNNTLTSNVRHDDPDMLAALKKSEEKEKAEGEQTFGVSPLPAFPGGVNPIKLEPGEKVPDASTLTGNTIHSTVKTDAESYEDSTGGVGNAPVLPPVVTPQADREKTGTGVLDVPPITKNLIPESSLPMGTSGVGTFDASPHIQSSGPDSTTAQLAAAVPLESSKVPEVVKESQKEAGVEPEASAVPEEVQEKSAVEKELESKVPEAPSTSEGIAGQGTTKSEKTVTAGEAGAAVIAAATALGGAAALAATNAASTVTSQLPESIQSKLPATTNAEPKVDIPAAKDTPEVVKESIKESGQSPEAAANEEAVLEKKAVEKELLAEVKTENATGESAPKPTAKLSAPEPEIDSRDVSPGTIPGSRVPTNAEGPTVTSGVASGTTKTETPATPTKAAASSSKPDTPASATTSQKKKNRASAFFSKLKHKLSDK